NYRDIRVIFLCKFKHGNTVAKIVENIKLAFKEDCVNVRTLQRWCVKFTIDDFSLEMKR
ncbi:hypothetical protein WH47_03785, partial [Habropoda laboriosa]